MTPASRRRPAARAPAALALALALSAACAAVEGRPPAGPPPFAQVKAIALVRRADHPGAARAKDPLDALQESLAARGYATRVVEVGGGADGALRNVEALHARLGGRVTGSERAGHVARLGPEVGETVAALGVDALVVYHRVEGFLLPPLPEPRTAWGPPFATPSRVRAPGRPAGALSLVDRTGTAAWFAWGASGDELEPSLALNAAEAIDALLRALEGEAEDGP
jgi:hypothetical protein